MRVVPLYILGMLLSGCASDYQAIAIDEGASYGVFQPDQPFDIMTVIDTSCSMDENWVDLEDNLYDFALDLSKRQVDWQIAMTTMDPSEDTVSNLITPEDNIALEILETVVEFDSCSSCYRESGFAAAIDRLSSNPEWFREEVPTVIIFVGDEPEQSNISQDLFLEAWPRELYIVSVVGPYREEDERHVTELGQCFAEAAPIYWDVSDVVVDLCTEEPWNLFEEIDSLGK
jgi:hypothetical protein